MAEAAEFAETQEELLSAAAAAGPRSRSLLMGDSCPSCGMLMDEAAEKDDALCRGSIQGELGRIREWPSSESRLWHSDQERSPSSDTMGRARSMVYSSEAILAQGWIYVFMQREDGIPLERGKGGLFADEKVSLKARRKQRGGGAKGRQDKEGFAAKTEPSTVVWSIGYLESCSEVKGRASRCGGERRG